MGLSSSSFYYSPERSHLLVTRRSQDREIRFVIYHELDNNGHIEFSEEVYLAHRPNS